uniref:Uncharacterized protein n=1 Tax=Tetraselmis chuii TaxID=63592 RepID=A0A7S1X1X7_9CHLO
MREPAEPARFIAIQGTEDLTYGAKRSQVVAAAPACAAALKEALHTREPVTVTLSLLAMRRLIRREPASVVAAMLPSLAQFLSPIALFNGSPLEVHPTYDRHKVVHMQEAIDGVLHAFTDHGGPEAAAIMTRHLPAWRQVNGTEAPSSRRKKRQAAPATRASTGVMPYTVV